MSPKCVIEIKNSIINLQEEDLILKSQLSFEDAFSLIFSAKESLFKALYPSVRAYFDFSSAKITAICCNTNSFTLTLLEDLTPELRADIEFKGNFIFDKNNVFTIIAQ